MTGWSHSVTKFLQLGLLNGGYSDFQLLCFSWSTGKWCRGSGSRQSNVRCLHTVLSAWLPARYVVPKKKRLGIKCTECLIEMLDTNPCMWSRSRLPVRDHVSSEEPAVGLCSSFHVCFIWFCMNLFVKFPTDCGGILSLTVWLHIRYLSPFPVPKHSWKDIVVW